MDELTAPRRSIHPSQHPTRQPRDPQDIPLSEYVVAMAIDIPQLELYTRVSRDLEAWMEKSKSVFADAEEEAAKVTPELFVEYARADEEGQAELLVRFVLNQVSKRFAENQPSSTNSTSLKLTLEDMPNQTGTIGN